MLIALPWEHEGPTGIFTRRKSKLRCGLTEGPTPRSLTAVPGSTIQVAQDWERGARSTARSSILALWATWGSTCPGQCPSIRCTLNLTILTQKSPFWSRPGRQVRGSSCVCYSNCERMIWVRGRHNCYSPGLKSVFFQWPFYCPSQSFFGKMTFLG